ncbi:MAG TPA: O-antigen ligase family protein [Bacteroidota bacterium]|nr:O-antigen ligase family protein [Bacteroidota bacterium]
MHKRDAAFLPVFGDSPARGTAPGQDGGMARTILFQAPRDARELDRWAIAFVVFIALAWGVGMVAGFQTALTLLTIGAFLAAIFGVHKPLVGLVGIGMLCTMDAMSRVLLLTGGLLRWNTLNYWLILVIGLNLSFVLRLRDIQSRLALLFVLLLTLGLLMVDAEDMETGIMSVLNTVIFFGIMVYFAPGRRNPRVWYLQGVVCGTLAALGSFVYFIQKDGLPYVNPNAWAYFPLTAIFAICLGYRFAPRGWRGQTLCWALAVANVGWVFLSGSRGSLLVASACMLFLLLTTRSVSQRIVYSALALVMALITITKFTDLNADAIHRISKLLDPQESYAARTSGRSDLALGAWYIFRDHPMGVGTGGFAQAWVNMGYRQSLSGFAYGKEMQAHSGWTKTLAENGIPGVLALLFFVGSFASVGWKRKRIGVWPLGLLATAVYVLAFLSTDFAGKGLWYFAAGATTLLNLRVLSVRRNPAREAGARTPAAAAQPAEMRP